MISFFDLYGGGGHETDGVSKIRETVFAMEFLLLDAPGGKIFESALQGVRS